MATSGVLLKNAERLATTTIIEVLNLFRLLLFPKSLLKSTLITDDFFNISLIISSNTITANCSFPKPLSASSGVSISPITSTIIAIKKITGGRNNSKYKAVSKKSITTKIITIGGVSMLLFNKMVQHRQAAQLDAKWFLIQ